MSFFKKYPRSIYFSVFILLFIAEVFIALYVRDSIVRPYVGDLLVTVLICAFVRALFLYRIKWLPLWVFGFSLAVEIGQYFDIVSFLGLSKISFFRTLIGTTFSFEDIVCYALGCLLFGITEEIIKRTR